MVPVREWPLWVRYVIAFGVGAAIVVALVIYVHDHQGQSEGLPAAASKSELAQEVKQDTTLVKQQQAPKVARLGAGLSPAQAASVAITRWMRGQTEKAFIMGPLHGTARCTARGASTARAVFRCRIAAGPKATRLEYPFDAVVSAPTGAVAAGGATKVTFCQVVTPPSAQVREPAISARCR
jgi:hypothetical protein